jgi:hypothetical protein
MALESLPKIAPALFSAEQDLIQIYNKKSDTVGTINASLLGGSTPPSGVSGAIQFSNGSAFGSDASNLFWDDTNNRLGVGTNAPIDTINSKGVIRVSRTDDTNSHLTMSAEGGFGRITAIGGIGVHLNETTTTVLQVLSGNVTIGNGTTGLSARVGIKGSGSTSATTSLLVQNSAGTELLKTYDDGSVSIGSQNGIVSLVSGYNNSFVQNRLTLYSAQTNIRGIYEGGQGLIVSKNTGITDLYPSSIFSIDSTTQGFLPPRMTDAQIRAIASPANGLIAYNTTTDHLCVYQGGAWVKINHSPM